MSVSSTLWPTRLVVIGVGADGWHSIPRVDRACIEEAAVVLGGARHLAMLPDTVTAQRRTWPTPLRDALPVLLDELSGRRVVVLASGDPMLSGIGTTLVDLLGSEQVDVRPGVSSVTLARARMGWSAESSVVVTTVGRRLERVLRELAPGRRILVLTSGSGSPGELAGLLVAAGHLQARLTVLADLGSTAETRLTALAADWHEIPDTRVPALHVLAVEVEPEYPGAWPGWTAGLPDDCFEHDGQLTKRDLRASALARLTPLPGEHLWDVGAGAGSVGIEWMRAHPTCHTTAVEANPQRAARIIRNAARLGVPDLDVVEGRAPDALADLPRPDAVFIGGGATRSGVLDGCLSALRPGGRLVVHGVTLETELLLAQAYRTHGGELTRISVESTDAIGTFTGWAPARTVTQWAWRHEI